MRRSTGPSSPVFPSRRITWRPDWAALQISWFHDGVRIQPEDVLANGSLSFARLAENAGGNYSCQGIGSTICWPSSSPRRPRTSDSPHSIPRPSHSIVVHVRQRPKQQPDDEKDLARPIFYPQFPSQSADRIPATRMARTNPSGRMEVRPSRRLGLRQPIRILSDGLQPQSGQQFVQQFSDGQNQRIADGYFEAAYKATLLFEGWNTKTVGEIVGYSILSLRISFPFSCTTEIRA